MYNRFNKQASASRSNSNSKSPKSGGNSIGSPYSRNGKIGLRTVDYRYDSYNQDEEQ